MIWQRVSTVARGRGVWRNGAGKCAIIRTVRQDGIILGGVWFKTTETVGKGRTEIVPAGSDQRGSQESGENC